MSDPKENLKLLFVVLNKAECLPSLLSLFVELGLKGATVIDSVGMGRILTHDIPIFAGVKNLFTGTRPGNKTIMIMLHEEMIPLVVEAFEQAVGPLDQPGNGMIITVPVERVFGGGE